MAQSGSATTTTAWKSVGRTADFPLDTFTLVTVRNREIGVYPSSDGRWFAVRNLCPHRGAPLCFGQVGATVLPSEPGEIVFGMEGEVVRCPWHALEFSLIDGESLFGASTVSISVYEVKVEDDEVLVSVRPRERKRTSPANQQQQSHDSKS